MTIESYNMTFLKKTFAINKKQTFFCALLSVASISACASNESLDGWSLEKEESGITTYSREVADHDINEVRGETKIKASVEQLVDLFMNQDNCALFSENCHSAKILNRKTDSEFDLYKMIKNPAPFSDRDVLLNVKVENSNDTGAVVISYKDIKGDMPQDDCCIRLESDKGYWKFMPLKDGYTHVTWQFHTNPGGALPAMLLNGVMPSLPVNLFNKIINKYK